MFEITGRRVGMLDMEFTWGNSLVYLSKLNKQDLEFMRDNLESTLQEIELKLKEFK